MAPAGGGAGVLYVNAVEGQAVLMRHTPLVYGPGMVVTVDGLACLVGAIGGTYGAVLGAEATKRISTNTVLCTWIIWERDPAVGHFYLKRTAGS